MAAICTFPGPETFKEILNLYLTMFEAQDEEDLQLLGKSGGPKQIKDGLIELTVEIALRLNTQDPSVQDLFHRLLTVWSSTIKMVRKSKMGPKCAKKILHGKKLLNVILGILEPTDSDPSNNLELK